MARSTAATTVHFLLLTMAIGWLCCRPCDSQTIYDTTEHLTSLTVSHPAYWNSFCNDHFYGHCNAPPDGKPAFGKLIPKTLPKWLWYSEHPYMLCFCDAQCRMYGDCCPDKVANDLEFINGQYINGSEPTKHQTNQSVIHWECYSMSTMNPTLGTGIYTIGSCPAEYPHNGIQQKCQRSVNETEYTYYLDIPVFSTKTRSPYANIYCAMCHNDMEVRQSSITIDCNGIENCIDDHALWKYVPKTRSWNYKGSIVSFEIFIKDGNSTYNLEEYADSTARKCHLGVVDRCPSSWPGAKEHQLCAAYAFYVQLLDDHIVYKNKYCAKCHHPLVEDKMLTCPVKILLTSADEDEMPHFSVLIDIGNLFGKVGESRHCGHSNEIECKLGEFCDPLYRVCHAYTCSSHYEMNANGECIKRLSSLIINNNETMTAPLDCPMRYVHLGEFVWKPNNSIYVNATDQTLPVSKYEVVNETTVLVCIDSSIMDFRKFSNSQAILSTVCITCSLACLMVHIAVYAMLPKLRNLPGMNLLCLSASIFVAQFLFEFGYQTSHIHELCVSIAILIHYGFLSSFFWMNVMAIDVYRTFAQQVSQPCNNRKFWKYGVYAWLMPFLIVGLAVFNNTFAFLVQFNPMYGEPLCWINNRQALFLFFAAPLAVLLFINLILFVLTTVGIIHVSKMGEFARQTGSTSSKSERTSFLLSVKLAVIMGLTWVFGFVAAFTDVEALWYLFIILNASQGMFIFLAFTCKRKVFNMLRARFCHCSDPGKNNSHAASSSSPKNSGMDTAQQTTTSSV